MIKLFSPIINEDMKKAAMDVISNDRLVLGKKCFEFEREFSEYIGTKHAVSLSSGTNALSISLESLGIKGKEVITSAYSFIASSNSIMHAGGKPVFVDTKENSFNMDLDSIEEKITDKTAGIIPVHLYGIPCEMDKIIEIAEKHNLFLLEDACQAHGAVYGDKKIGNLGTAGCFSFYPTKNMTVGGDGGMITTNSNEIAESARKLANCGRKEQYLHDAVGYTSRLNSINAAIGNEQLKLLDNWVKRRNDIANSYKQALEGVGDIQVPTVPEKSMASYSLYVIRTKKRDELKEFLGNKGIESGVYYPIPIPFQPSYESYGFSRSDFPNSIKSCTENLAIPIHPSLTETEIERIINEIQSFFK